MSDRYTIAQVRTIMELRDQGLTAKAIAERFGRSTGSIYSVIHRTKHGWAVGGHEAGAKRTERIIWLFEQGITVTELSLIFDISAATINVMLSRRGLDRELRREVVNRLPPIARIAHQAS